MAGDGHLNCDCVRRHCSGPTVLSRRRARASAPVRRSVARWWPLCAASSLSTKSTRTGGTALAWSGAGVVLDRRSHPHRQAAGGGWTVLVDRAGRLLRLVQVGDVQRYLAVFAIGLAALVYVMARPPHLPR